ncbi:MAG: T9SS type A sorting domain-containing protein [Bacteroidota bacterium]
MRRCRYRPRSFRTLDLLPTMRYPILVALLLLAPLASAQTVSSISFPTSQTMDGLYVDDTDGQLYAVGGFVGTKVYAVGLDGTLSTFADGLVGPIHLTRAPDGNLYVTEFTPLNTESATVSRVTPAGEVSQFAVVRAGPSDIVADAEGNLYVSHYGVVSNDPATNGNGDSISKITPEGVVTDFAQGGLLSAPVGLDFDDAGNLYAANIFDGRIVQIAPDGTQSLFATLPVQQPFTIGHLVWADGKLYATHLGANQVHVFERDGSGRVFAGSGVPGRSDGPADEARFNSPNGIAASVTGDTLYVSEYIGAVDRIRMITPGGIVSTETAPATSTMTMGAFPNPSTGDVRLAFILPESASVTVSVYDTLGREVARLFDGAKSAGAHELAWERGTLPAGVYVLRLRAGAQQVTTRAVLR